MTCDLFTSLPALEAACLPISSSAIRPSPPSKSIPTVATCLDSAAMMAGFQGSPSTKPISATLTHPSTPAEWISSQAASLARISPPLAKGPALPASGQDSGANLPGLLATFDPASSSWKTAQCSLFGDLMSSSLTLPRSGSMRNGKLYQRPRLALPIAERESGFWQTPVADDAVNRIKGKINSRGEPKLSAQVLWRTPTVGMLNADRAKDPEYANRKRAKGQTITLADQVKWPTPRARDAQPEGLQSGMDRMGKYATCSLPTAVALWPTPTVCGNYNRKGASAASGDGLATAVAKYATPQARDHRTGQQSRFTDPARTKNLNDQIGGQLNPTWVEWLMGWPIGWTDSKPSAMDKSRSKPPSPGKRSRNAITHELLETA